MNIWIFYCIFAAFLFAIVNHVDKHLVSRYFKGLNIGSLVIITSLVGLPVIGFILFMHQDVLNISAFNAFLLVISGVCITLSFLPYFLALEKDEASQVVPLFQMVPIISFIFSFIFLGEQLSLIQILGSFAVMIGSVLLSAEFFEGKKIQFKRSVFGLMFLASFFYAVDVFLFKVSALDVNFWTASFWEYLGLSLVSITLLTFVPYYRKQLFSVLKKNSRTVLTLSFSNELFVNIGKISVHYASLLGPLSLVTLVSEGFQPIFVLIIGIVLTLFWPQFGQENISKTSLLKKCISIVIILFGSALISQ